MPQKKHYKWYPNVSRYRNKKGRFTSERQVSGHIDKITRKFSEELKVSSEKMLQDFSQEAFNKWSRETRHKLQTMHNAVTVIALGGKRASLRFATENRVAWAEAENALGQQLRYFDRFMLASLSGAVSDAQFIQRASMYPLAGYGTYENAVRMRKLIQNGDLEESRELDPSAEHCEDCLLEADRKWQPIGTLRRIGDSQCVSRCRCRFKYRKKQANGS